MRQIKQGAERTVMLLMVSSTDHVSGVAGASLILTLSKAGGAFGAVAPGIVDRGAGWYAVALGVGDSDTLGDLAIHATAAACDPSDALLEVVAYDPQDSLALGLSRVDAAVSTRAAENGGRVEDIHLDVGDIHNDVGTVISTTDTIVAKTNNLPSDPADESLLEAAIATRAAAGDAMTLTAAYDAAKTAAQAGAGMGLTAGAVDAILDEVVEGALTLRQLLRVLLSGIAGKVSGSPAGPILYRDLADAKARITGTVDPDGNRTAVTIDGT